MSQTRTRRTYTFTRRVIVICSECNEDITRPHGEEAETMADARRIRDEHEEMHRADDER